MSKDKPRYEKILDEGGSLPLDSHVQGGRVYGEPKGPLPGSMFDHRRETDRPVDRNRDGFVGRAATIEKGDKVGSGPEETHRLPPDAEANDGPPVSYSKAAIENPEAVSTDVKSKT